MTAVCSCGYATRHEIARRRTADGLSVVLWSDGTLSGRLAALPGLPCVRPRTDKAKSAALAAGWLLLGEVELYSRADLSALYDACRWTAARDGLPGTVRARMHRAPRLHPVWTLLETDREGNPVERYWRLPRLRWPGLAVWNRVNAALPYELMNVDRHGTCKTTGFRFRTLEDLSRHLAEEAP